MNASPSVEQNAAMLCDEPQRPPSIRFGAGKGFAQFNPEQINHRFPIRSDDMNMCGRMVIWINDEP
jgi:hypothetical protein